MPDPMWRRIAEDLRLKIKSGQLGSNGKPLPSELELRETYDAPRNTVRDAVKWLVTRGLVVTRPGQGTFVQKDVDPFVTSLSAELDATLGGHSGGYLAEVAARSRAINVSSSSVEVQSAQGPVASELQLGADTTVVSRHQKRDIDGKPWSVQTTFYPMYLVEMGARSLNEASDRPEGTVWCVEARLGIKAAAPTGARTVSLPSRDGSKQPDGARFAVIEIVATGHDSSGQPFRSTITTYPADKNRFKMVVGEVPPPAGIKFCATGRRLAPLAIMHSLT